MKSSTIDAVFVYGTLKRGQCRASLWPAQPLDVIAAWTRGHLFDRSDYPALSPGEDRVLGEIWRFEAADMSRVLETLDRIEGSNQPGAADLYRRVTTEAWDLDGHAMRVAYAYHYAIDPAEDGFRRLTPTPQQPMVQWPLT